MLFTLVGQASSIPNKGWGLGLQFNYPFTGLSIRFFNAKGIGFELNIFPQPTPEEHQLKLTISGKVLYPVRQDKSINYYLCGGGGITFDFEEKETPPQKALKKQPRIHSKVDKTFLAGVGALEFERIWLDRMAATFEYGLTWEPLTLNLSLLTGGLGIHYYFGYITG